MIFTRGRQWAAAMANPAYAAALALVIIQVVIGVIYKLAAQGGKSKSSYSFSPSGSVTISETIKFLISAGLFYQECRRRQSTVPKYTHVDDDKQEDLRSPESFVEDEEDPERDIEKASESTYMNGHGEKKAAEKILTGKRPHLKFREFVALVKAEVPQEAKFGYCQLAMLYAFINNMIYVAYKLADPGTIQLLKSGVTLVTAMTMYFTTGTKLTRMQWVAIMFQLCGLVTTQYHPDKGSTYSLSTYLLLICMTIVSAVSGVYNQKLNKSQNASLHVDNMVLYTAGAGMNLMIHIINRIFKSDEPGFFTGYGNPAAFMVIMSNVFIGLIITAVYKYANAIIKCFATAVATGLLLYLSPILFGTQLSFLTLPGTFVVFASTWLYMESTPPNDPNNEHGAVKSSPPGSALVKALLGRLPNLHLSRKVITILYSTFTIILINTLWISSSNLQDQRNISSSDGSNIGELYRGKVIESPFKKSLGFVRFNTAKVDSRIKDMKPYEAFFHTMHYSIPNNEDLLNLDYNNLTRDNFNSPFQIYSAVSDSMQQILDAPAGSPASEIQGLLYFHFDSWIDPLAFSKEDLSNIWILDGPEPPYLCTKKTEDFKDWWGWDMKHHEVIQRVQHKLLSMQRPPPKDPEQKGDEATAEDFSSSKPRQVKQKQKRSPSPNPDPSPASISPAARGPLNYVFDPDEFCVGWSDIYYIPRRFFADFILLSAVFASEAAFHENAIPTIIHIIDQTRRPVVPASVAQNNRSPHPKKPKKKHSKNKGGKGKDGKKNGEAEEMAPAPWLSVVSKIGDCWGSCCTDAAPIEAVMWSRCGHRMDMRDRDVVRAHFARVDEEASVLGTQMGEFVPGGEWGRGLAHRVKGGGEASIQEMKKKEEQEGGKDVEEKEKEREREKERKEMENGEGKWFSGVRGKMEGWLGRWRGEAKNKSKGKGHRKGKGRGRKKGPKKAE